MKFIVENWDTVVSEQIDESSGKKEMYIEGIYMQDSIKNRNGRMYPKEVMREAVHKYNETYIKSKRAMGELNHPSTPSVNPERATHLMTSLREDGNNWIGKAKVLNTPMGNLVRNLINDGVQLGVSSRGLGAVKESNGVNVVQSGLMFTAVDVVSDPSAPEAFVNGVMENKEWIFENGILVEKQIEEIQTEVNKLARAGKLNAGAMDAIFKKLS